MPARRPSGKELSFTVFQRYRAPAYKLWEAVTEAKHLNRYFTHGTTGNISPAMKPVAWRWGRGAIAKLHVVACEPKKYFEFQWTGPGNYATTVRFEFSREGGKTIVRIKEWGWKPTQIDGALDHCGGWSEYLYGLKAYVQHGIDLRK